MAAFQGGGGGTGPQGAASEASAGTNCSPLPQLQTSAFIGILMWRNGNYSHQGG